MSPACVPFHFFPCIKSICKRNVCLSIFSCPDRVWKWIDWRSSKWVGETNWKMIALPSPYSWIMRPQCWLSEKAQQVTMSLTEWPFDFEVIGCQILTLFSVMMRHDQTKKTKIFILRSHSKTSVFCDIWSEWWEVMTWPMKKHLQRAIIYWYQRSGGVFEVLSQWRADFRAVCSI